MPQNLRFQGQYLDRESGLHYNLFRYYDPVAKHYRKMNPIGLADWIKTCSCILLSSRYGSPKRRIDCYSFQDNLQGALSHCSKHRNLTASGLCSEVDRYIKNVFPD
ncbi:RHS repeat-associated core domain-containing protein [Cronobacter turicensis]|nr:RHS repeat-associated core domain-containing protein [Cronobacter turicensis]MDK1337429.1 RHS repeat-associated core domain-containing protein [Cronobacter turicensis]